MSFGRGGLGVRTQAFLLFTLCCFILFMALRLRSIGGAGVGADRDKNPLNFWLGVGTTAFMGIVALVLFVSTLVR